MIISYPIMGKLELDRVEIPHMSTPEMRLSNTDSPASPESCCSICSILFERSDIVGWFAAGTNGYSSTYDPLKNWTSLLVAHISSHLIDNDCDWLGALPANSGDYIIEVDETTVGHSDMSPLFAVH